MGRHRTEPGNLGEMCALYNRLRATGLGKCEAYRRVGEAVGRSATCVYYYVNPAAYDAVLARRRKRYRSLHHRETVQRRNYSRLTRTPHRFLAQVFDTEDQLTLGEIHRRLPDVAEGTRFHASTVQRILGEYVAQARGPPFLREVEPGVYRRVDGPRLPGGLPPSIYT